MSGLVYGLYRIIILLHCKKRINLCSAELFTVIFHSFEAGFQASNKEK